MDDMRTGICPVCSHNEVIEAIPRDLGDESAEYQAVTYEAVDFGSLVPVYQRVAHGVLRMYVCRSCGYTQYYADNPGTIPIGDQYLTKLIKR
jgi:rubrerythrin